MSNDLLKPKNQTLEERKKHDRVFIPEIHSSPDLMSHAEKLEFAEEILSELLGEFLEQESLQVEVKGVEDNEIVLLADGGFTGEQMVMMQSLIKEETQGVFEFRFEAF